LVKANVYTDLATLQSDDRTRRYGREVWRWLLIGLLVAMIAELFLQQRAVRTPSVRAS
jgi:FtsH-binding integral membrane protein